MHVCVYVSVLVCIVSCVVVSVCSDAFESRTKLYLGKRPNGIWIQDQIVFMSRTKSYVGVWVLQGV